MSTATIPTRRFQFSLWTFLALITLGSMGFGVWAYSCREWIRQRQDLRGRVKVLVGHGMPEATAPGGLWLFGEQGDEAIRCGPSDAEEVRRLFPEAVVLEEPHFRMY
jgi:hypothetical protein